MEKKHQFKSGATSSENKPPYDQIPLSFLVRTARRFELGAKKHGKFNYIKGLKDKDFILDRCNHALEHLKLAMTQIEHGEVNSDDDLGAVAWNVAIIMEYQRINEQIPEENE